MNCETGDEHDMTVSKCMELRNLSTSTARVEDDHDQARHNLDRDCT